MNRQTKKNNLCWNMLMRTCAAVVGLLGSHGIVLAGQDEWSKGFSLPSDEWSRQAGLLWAETNRAALVQSLRSDDSARSLAAAIVLSVGRVVGTPEERDVEEMLTKGLQDQSVVARAHSAKAIRNLSVVEAAIPLLLKTLADREPAVREASALTLANYGTHTNQIMPALIRLHEHRDSGVRATGLGLIGNSRLGIGTAAVAHLLLGLQDEAPCVRQAALRGLGADAASVRGGLSAIARVAYSDPEPALRTEAVAALARLGPGAVPDLVEILGGTIAALHRLAVTGLGQYARASKLAMDALIRTAANEKADYDIRYLAVYLLKETGPAARDAIPPLRRLLSYPNPQMQMNATEALRSIEVEGATPDKGEE